MWPGSVTSRRGYGPLCVPHHSHTLPVMSCSPHGIASYVPTGATNGCPSSTSHVVRGHCACTFFRLRSPTLARCPVLSSSAPHQNRAPLPPRHAHSHCASVGRAYSHPAAVGLLAS